MVVSEIHGGSDCVAERRAANRRIRKERRIGEPAARSAVSTERRKVERRRQIDPTTCEREYSDSEIEFMRAMDEYKRRSGRQFPTWSEVLEVLHAIGYRKVQEASEIYPEGKNH